MADVKVDRVVTGITGLDEILNGGIPSKNQVLIAGASGTGKTLMAFETLYNCARKGIHSAFVSFDERSENIIKNVKNTFTYMNDLDELIRRGLLVIDGEDAASKISTNTESETGYSMGNMVSDVEGIVKSINAEVAVVDSLSFLKLMLGDSILYDKSVASLISNLRRMQVTSIFTADVPYYERERMKYVQELLLFDGVINLYHLHSGEVEQLGLEVVKMRGSDHKKIISKYDITPSGITFK